MHGVAEVSGDFVYLALGYPAFSEVLWNSWGEGIQQINFTAGSYEEACDQLLDYLKDSVNDGDVTSWFINEE